MSAELASAGAARRFWRMHWSLWGPLFILVAVVFTFGSLEPAFLSDRNLTNLARQVSVSSILAFGMTCIVLLGAIDLSVGGVLALGSVVGALLQVRYGFDQLGFLGAILTFAAVVFVCSSAGAFTGTLVSRFKMAPFVVSIGVYVMARGLALILSGGSKIAPLSDAYRSVGTSFVPPTESFILILFASIAMTTQLLTTRGQNIWGKLAAVWTIAIISIRVFYFYLGIPTPVLLMVMCFACVYFLLNRTTFGRFVYAIGGNREAARLCGIRVQLISFVTFVLMGFFVAVSAMIEGGRIDAGDPNAGNFYEIDAIAAVVIGGTSLRGGVGTVGGTLLGAFLIGTINNGMSLMNIPANYQMIIKGAIIITAVGMDVISKRSHRE